MSDKRIPVLWFSASGGGPDEFALELNEFPSADMANNLGLRVRGNGVVINGADLVDGGFMLGRKQVLALHAQLGGWLERGDR